MLLAAPADTRATTPLLLYDLQLPDELTAVLIGYDARGQPLIQADVHRRPEHVIEATLTYGERSVTLILKTVTKDGQSTVEGELDGQPFTITSTGEQATAVAQITLADDTRAALRHWGRLAADLDALARALRVRPGGVAFEAAGFDCSAAAMSIAAHAVDCVTASIAVPIVGVFACEYTVGQLITYTQQC